MRTGKGFTMIELMVVVAVLGILAMIAVPSYLRYQLRSKLAELRTNVEALRKSEESLRHSERMVCPNAATGAYVAFGRIPIGVTPGPARFVWRQQDYAAASLLDWNVEGATYGVYQGATVAPPEVIAPALDTCAAVPPLGPLGLGYALDASSDVDGDGVLSKVAMWRPVRDVGGGVLTAAPGIANGSNASCGGDTQPANVGDGQIVTCSKDDVF